MKGIFSKTVTFIILLLVPTFILMNFSFFRSKKDLSLNVSRDFLNSDSIVLDKNFVFLIYSARDPNTIEQNIQSILEQKYENYRILLMETDLIKSETSMIRQMVAKAGKAHLLTVIPFKEITPSIESFWLALETIKNDEIVIQIESNDWLANDFVLDKLNQIYSQSKEIWLTYSEFLEYPSYQKGSVDPYVKKMLRNRKEKKIPWITAPMKIYYAGLFKELSHQKSLNYKKSIDSNHLEFFFKPLAEYSKHHIRFIQEVLYVHNSKLDESKEN
jgi:hypothetical protein